MKNSKTTLMELSHNYRRILRKCALMNAAVFLSFAMVTPAMADNSYKIITTDGENGTLLTDYYPDDSQDPVITPITGNLTDVDWSVVTNNQNLALQVNDSTVIFDGNKTVISGKDNAVLTSGVSSAAFRTNGESHLTFSGNDTDISHISLGEASGKWGFALDVRDTSTALFNGSGNVHFSAYRDQYTAQTLSVRANASAHFENGGNVIIDAKSPSGSTGLTQQGTFTVNIGGDLTINAGYASDANSAYDASQKMIGTNAVPVQIQGAGTTTMNAQNIYLNSYGQGYNYKTNSSFSDGSMGLEIGYGDMIVKSNTFNINVLSTADIDDNHHTSFGILFEDAKDSGSLTVDAVSNITVSNKGNAYGLGMTSADDQATFNDVLNMTVSGVNMAKGFSLEKGELTTKDVTVQTTATNGTAIGLEIAEGATVNLSGAATFVTSGTTDDTIDVNNAGQLNVAGVLTLNTGIVNTGTIAFSSGSSLTPLSNGNTLISGEGTITGETQLILGNGAAGSTIVMEGSKDNFKLTENTLYEFNLGDDNKTYTVAKKSSDEIISNLTSSGAATAQEAAVISAVADSTSDHAALTAITTSLQANDVKTATKAAQSLAPTTSRQVLAVAQDVNTLLTNVTGHRLAAVGRSGGDAFIGGSAWMQGLYNYSKQDASGSSSGFHANTTGFVLGIDGQANEAITLGAGYGYAYTDADTDGRDIDVNGHNFFVYGAYQPEQFYVNTMLSYGINKYTEKKNPAGVKMKSKYDVHTFAANIMTGYHFDSGITPEGGLRYIMADQESYYDGAQTVETDNNDVLTAVLGAKYTTSIQAADWTLKPTFRLAATYDIKSDSSQASVSLVGGGNYQIIGERLHRFGVETGVGITSTVKDWDVTLEYNGGFRKDYQSHSGMLKAKYHF